MGKNAPRETNVAGLARMPKMDLADGRAVIAPLLVGARRKSVDKYTATEEAYKKGREDAINVISHRIFSYVMCRECPASKFCTAENGCANAFAEWMRGLFEGG